MENKTFAQEEEIRLKILKQIIDLPVDQKTDWIQKYKTLYPSRDIEADVIEFVGKQEKPKSSFESMMDSFLGGVRSASESFMDDIRLATEKLKKIEEPATKVIDKTLDVVAKHGSDLFGKAKDNYDKLSKNALNMKVEDDLCNNFDEDKFVELILNGTIKFTQSNQAKYDFFDFKGNQNKWASTNGYFTLVVNEKNQVLFKINNIDYRQLLRRVEVKSLPRIYNAIVYGNDSTEIVDPTLKF